MWLLKKITTSTETSIGNLKNWSGTTYLIMGRTTRLIFIKLLEWLVFLGKTFLASLVLLTVFSLLYLILLVKMNAKTLISLIKTKTMDEANSKSQSETKNTQSKEEQKNI